MRTRGLRIFAAVLVASGVACKLLPTRDLSTAFNGGVLDSTYDNAYPRFQRAADTVMWRMRDELGEGYFDQGPGSTHTVGWLTELERHAGVFMEDALRTGNVTADLDASFVPPPPAVTNVSLAKPGLIAQPAQRLQRVLWHSQLQIPLGFPPDFRRPNSVQSHGLGPPDVHGLFTEPF